MTCFYDIPQARLSRMSASTARGDADVTSSEEEDDDGSSSVLITEIKVSEVVG